MNINIQHWIKEIINSKTKFAMPVMTYPGLDFTGKKVIDLVTKGEEQFKCIEALATKYPSIASVMVMDLSLEAEAFGAKITMSENEVPTVTERLVFDSDSINALIVPPIGSGRTNEYIKAAKLSSEHITSKAIFGGIIGPYSLSGRLYDITEMMMFILIEPNAAHTLLQKSTDFLKKYALEYKKAGINGIIIAEPAAGLLSADMCHEFSSHYVKEIVDYVQDENFMVILHNCGNTVELVPSMLSTNAKGLHFGNAVDMKDILPQITPEVIVFGNIEPAGVLKNGSPEIVKKVTLELLQKTASYKNFVLSSGCDVPPGTPIQNINAFYEALFLFNNNYINH